MGLIVGFGDYGIGDKIDKAEELYQLLLDLCGDQLDWSNILNKPELYTKDETYNKEEVDDLITAAEPGEHTHTISEITGLQDALDERYTKTETDTLLDGKAEVDHTHTTAEIIGLDAAIAALGVQIVAELPMPVVDGKVYMWHPAGADKFTPVISAGGVYIPLDAVTYSALSIALAAKQNKFTGLPAQYVKGDGTYGTFNKAAVGLGNVDNTSDANKPVSDATNVALSNKANDSDVLKKTGNQTKTSGVLTFMISPEVPEPVNSLDAANKGYIDAVKDSILQDEIEFNIASEEWIWMHNLNRKPSVDVVVGGDSVGARVHYLDNDTLKISFTKPQIGSIIVR